MYRLWMQKKKKVLLGSLKALVLELLPSVHRDKVKTLCWNNVKNGVKQSNGEMRSS